MIKTIILIERNMNHLKKAKQETFNHLRFLPSRKIDKKKMTDNQAQEQMS